MPIYEDSNHLNPIGAEAIIGPTADTVVSILKRRATATATAPSR